MASEEFQRPPWYATDLNLGSHFHDHSPVTIAIFFISIVLILSFIFFNFVCHCGRSSINTSASSRSATVVTAGAATQSKGLDAAIINSLPSYLHSSLPNSIVAVKERECSICLGLFQENELLKVMPECLHAFHSECVDKWLSTRPSCPLCRGSLDSFSASILTV